MDGEVPNLVQGESGGDDGVAAVLAGDQPAPGAGNTSCVSAAPAGGIAFARANVSGAKASCLRDPFDAATSADSPPASSALSASPAESFVGPPCKRRVYGHGKHGGRGGQCFSRSSTQNMAM